MRGVPSCAALTRAARAQAVYSAFARFRERHSLPRVPQYDRAHAQQRAEAGAAPPPPPDPAGGPSARGAVAGAGLCLGASVCAKIDEEEDDEGSWPGTKEAADAHDARRARAQAAAAGAPAMDFACGFLHGTCEQCASHLLSLVPVNEGGCAALLVRLAPAAVGCGLVKRAAAGK